MLQAVGATGGLGQTELRLFAALRHALEQSEGVTPGKVITPKRVPIGDTTFFGCHSFAALESLSSSAAKEQV